MVHQRLRAVMSGPNGDAVMVDDRRNVMRMRTIHGEGHDTRLAGSGADQVQPLDSRQALMRVAQNLLLMRADRLHADRLHIVDGGAERDRLGDGGRSRLEANGRLGIGRFFDGDPVDHVAAAKERRHVGQNLGPSPQHADPVRTIQLVR